MALAQFLGDVVDPADHAVVAAVLGIQTPHQTGDGLIHALNGDGRATLGRLQPLGHHLDRGRQALDRIVAGQTVGIVQTAAAAAPLIGVSHMGTAGQRDDPVLVIAFHNHGVQPLAQGHT